MNGLVINGWFLTERTLGIQRVARELVRALDAIVPAGRVELLAPRSAVDVPEYANIRVVRRGTCGWFLWEQLVLPVYAYAHGRVPVSFCNVVPLLCPGIVCIHDVCYRTMAPMFRKSPRGLLSMLWHRLHYRWAALFARRILTVSEFSKREIMRLYGVPDGRIDVIFNGWEHLTRVEPDESVFERFPSLKGGGYYFVLGSLAEYKNLRWIFESAARYPCIRYVITGGGMESAMPDCLNGVCPANVCFTGFLDDAEVKALLLRCRALVQPSKAEGFGLPPLEALSLGREIIVSRRTAMPEVYGTAAHYIEDPEDYAMVDPDALLAKPTTGAADVLARCSWRNSARILLACLKLENTLDFRLIV